MLCDQVVRFVRLGMRRIASRCRLGNSARKSLRTSGPTFAPTYDRMVIAPPILRKAARSPVSSASSSAVSWFPLRRSRIRLATRKELLHHFGRLAALVDVVTQKHRAACRARRGRRKAPEGAQVPVNIAHERDLGTHSRIFSTSA